MTRSPVTRLLGSLIFILIPALGMNRPVLPPHGRMAVCWTLACAVATAACLLTAFQLPKGDRRRAWQLFGAGCAAWLAGQLVADWRGYHGETVIPAGGIRDWLQLLMAPFFAWGMFYLRPRNESVPTAFRKLCNLGILACCLSGIQLLLSEGRFHGLDRAPSFILTILAWMVLLPTVFAFGLLCLCLYLPSGAWRMHAPLLGGLGLHAAGNIFFAHTQLNRDYEMGHSASDYLWLLGFAWLAWAALEEAERPAEVEPAPSRDNQLPSRATALEAGLPALAMLAVVGLGTAMPGYIDPHSGEYLVPIMGVLICLIGLREWWAHRSDHGLISRLKASETRFRHVMDCNMAGLFFWDVHGKVVEANDAFLELTGYARGDLDAGLLSWRSMTPPEYAESDARALEEIRTSGVCRSYEKEFIRKDGTRIPLLVGGAASADNPEIGTGFVVDLSARRTAERGLQEAESRYRTLAERNATGIWHVDVDGTTVYANPHMLEMLQVESLDELTGESFRRFFSPEAIAVIEQEHQKRFAGISSSYEVELIGKRGRRMPTLVSGGPVHATDGTICGLIATFSDLTQLKHAQDALRHNQEWFRTLVENARDAIFTLSEDGLLTSLNPAAAVITGFPITDWLGKSFRPLVHPDDQPHALEIFHAALRGEKLPPFELRLRTSSGGYIVLEFTITPQIGNGKVTSVFGIGRDISLRRQLEEQLRQAQKMESIGQLAGGVAHDFNNLLTIIQGNASLMLMDETLRPDVLEMAREISEAGDRASGLTRQLLTFSRRQLIQARDVNLHELVSNLGKMLHRLLGEDITLQLESASGLPPIHGDPGMMEQVIMNLAINARDAMPDGGRLSVSTSHLLVSDTIRERNPEARAGHFVRLAVADSGHGIAPENLSRIFEPFFTTKDVGRGTGLGLATVYGIVKQHRGWVEVRSELHKGTVFEIYLPASEKRELTLPEPLDLALPRGRETILLVEDELPVRGVVREILSRLGYQIIEAGSGLEALQIWEHHQNEIDMLFTDIVLPDGLSGPQLADVLRERMPRLKVLFTSGYSTALILKEGRPRDGVRQLQKPYRPRQLAEAVRNVLDSSDDDLANDGILRLGA